MQLYKIKNTFTLTIFGASGDLAKLKIFPSLYSLMEQKRFPEEFYIIGFARSKKTQKQFQKEFEKSVREKHGNDIDTKILQKLLDKVHYFQGQYDEIDSYKEYKDYIKELTGSKKATHMAYLSVPPSMFEPIVENLGALKKKNEDLRLIIEKPFGHNCESAKRLFHFISTYFDEEQVYLLDHYLGKSAVQSILTLRHYNYLLNIMLQGGHISNIQVTAGEDFGVAHRINYFDDTGVIKDMIQSHLLQLLAFAAMSIPMTDCAESIHREKASLLAALKFKKDKKNVVIGQYEDYKKAKGVKKDSATETFAALRLTIDRETWANTPIYLRTGKNLAKKQTAVVVEFKKSFFQEKGEEPNLLILEIYPKEKLSIRLIDKNGVSQDTYKSIETSQSIACTGDDCLPEHGLLLLDVIRGRKTYFLSFPEILAAWDVVESVLCFVKKAKIAPVKYKNCSKGPVEQDKLPAQDGFKWHSLE